MGQFANRPDFAVTATAVSGDTTFDSPVALYIGGAGDVAVIPSGQAGSVVFAGLTAGTFLPVAVDELVASGTTATSILALT